MFEKIRLFFAQFTRAHRDAETMLEAHAVLEKHGLTALWWRDDATIDLDKAAKGEMDLFVAVKTLRKMGCIVVDQEGNLIGRVFKEFDSKEDVIRKRRAAFRLVDTAKDDDPNSE